MQKDLKNAERRERIIKKKKKNITNDENADQTEPENQAVN